MSGADDKGAGEGPGLGVVGKKGVGLVKREGG